MKSVQLTQLEKEEEVTTTVPPIAPVAIQPTSNAATDWGQLPILSLLGAIGLLVLAFANTEARHNSSWSGFLFWVGILAMYLPVAVRLASFQPSRRERIGLVVLLGLGVYFVKVLHSPIAFTFHDEFVHWRTANDIVQTGHLFNENPTIPVSPLYPGLQIVTNAIMGLTGLDIYGAGLLLVGVGRIMLILALYLFFEEISHSSRLAGIAALIYMANPNFTFFSAQYAYESLSLPFAAWVFFLVARRARAVGSARIGLNLAVVLGLGVVVITHHLTSYAVVGFLAVWAIAGFLWKLGGKIIQRYAGQISTRQLFAETFGQLFKRGQTKMPGSRPASTMLLILVACLSWLVYVATFTIGYLAPVLRDALIEVIRLIAGEASSRQLFKGAAGQVAPLWEQLIGFGAVGLLMIGVPLGLWQIWQHYRDKQLAITLALVSFAYPVSLGLRLTTAGWEVANRASEFVFIAVAFVVGLGYTKLKLDKTKLRLGFKAWSMLFTTCITIMFMGGIIAGWPPWARMPGSYLVAADTRSIEPQSVTAAYWAGRYLGPNQRVAADRMNALLLLSYGRQHMVLGVGEKVNIGWIFFSEYVGRVERDVFERGRIQYLVVDRRLTTALPMVGVYFEAGEPDSGRHLTPLDPKVQQKFEKEPNVSRLFDSGDITIYDVGELSHVP